MKQKSTVILLFFLMYLPAGFAFDFKLESSFEKKSFVSLTDHKPFIAGESNQINLNLAMSDEIGGGKINTAISAVAPGVGLWRVTGSPIFLVFLPVCYGTVGFGTLRYNQGKKEYQNYMIEKNPEQQDIYLESAQDKNEQGLRLIWTGVALWVIQTGWTFVYGSYNDLYRKRNREWNNKITFLPGGYDVTTKSFSFTTTLKF